MLKCEHCRDRLLDHVYGLLEANELHETQAHLDACAECRAAFTKVQTEQKLFARAAKAITEVPEFILPTGDLALIPLESSAPTHAEAAPFTRSPERKRSLWLRPWVAWAGAAAIVMAVLAPVIWYRNALKGYQEEVATARKAYKDVELELAALPAAFAPLHDRAIQDIRASANPHLHVVGPKALESHAKAQLDIITRHPEGNLAACNLTIKLLDGKNVIHVARPLSDGHARVEIDAASARPNTTLTLLVEADTPRGRSRLQESVQVNPANHVTRIDTNKQIYQTRDVLFFRVLVLDRFTLQPPSQPIPLAVRLVHEKTPVRTLERMTGAGGILAAEFAIEEGFAEGAYTLEINPVDASKFNVQAASIPLQIVRELPGIRLDQNRYARGEKLTGDIVLPGDQPVPKMIVGTLDGKPLAITLEQRDGAAGGFGGYGSGGGAFNVKPDKDAAKADRLYRFSTAPIPAGAAPGASQLRLAMPFKTDKKKQEIDAVVSLEPTDFAIDFFPEGGDLVAGVQNRVFYRVRSTSGRPVTGEGKVILLTSKNEVVDSPYQLGMGYLDFVPDLKERYAVRITTPAKTDELGIQDQSVAAAVGCAEWFATPFARLGIRREGVVLQIADPQEEHAPKAVGVQGDPICVTLRRQGAPARLLLVAHCRGQIIDQKWVEVKREPIDVTLQPTPEAHGMIRVTAYELAADALEPIAERLVYRAPTSRLDLTFTPNTPNFQPGKTVSAKIGAVDEAGKSAKAWVLASVVDERFQAKPRSLSAHFLLLNEVRTGPDLEAAQVLLHDSPESIQVLERFLGTHGWRRYVAGPALGIVPAANMAAARAPLVFSRENAPLEALQGQYQDRIAQSLKPIRMEAFEKQIQLSNERERRAAAVNILSGQLHNFETQVQVGIRVALGILLALVLSVSLILMGVGIYRTFRAHKSATSAFGSAFACLAGCLGIYFAGNMLGSPETSEPIMIRIARDAPQDRQVMEERLAQGPAVRHVHESIPTGAFSLRSAQKEAELQQAPLNADRKGGDAAKRELKAAQDEQLMTMARRGENAALAARPNAPTNERLRDWFENARSAAAPPMAKGVLVKPDAKKLQEVQNGARQLEYPYQSGPQPLADTLLWHPALFLENGDAVVRFDIAPGQATTYRVLLLGHGPTGRFGYYETRLDVPAYSGR